MSFASIVLKLGLCLLVLFASVARAAEKPNIIVIMADDLGYGDLSCYGATRIQTPNIDRLAAQGQRFTAGYASASTCTPTRFSLITGTYAFRQKGTGIAAPNAAALIKPGTETLPSLLKKAGYQTAIIGKWHLGLGENKPDWNGELKPGPREIGFDYNFVLPTTNDRVPQVFVENHRVQNLDPQDPLWVGDTKPTEDHPTGITHRDSLKLDWSHGHNNSIHNGIGRIGFYTGGQKARFRDEDLADEWIRQSVKWIETNKGKPFFLFFASHDLHVPRMPHERFQGKSPMGLRGDAILQFDWSVGELMKTLERLKIADNTLVVLCSDNGPVLDDGYKDGAVEKLGDHRPAGPWSGNKGGIFEGSTRTPFITHWPNRIKPGVSDKIVSTIDLAASFADLAGVLLPDNAALDSFDVLDALLGKPDARGREHLVTQDNSANNFGLREGNWKLQVRGFNRPKKDISLYDLAKDPAEKKDLAEEFPAIVERLTARLQKIMDDGHSRN